MRKGQEEIVGFVLIIVMVAIIFLVFLGISIRKGEVTNTESVEVYQFLESGMEFTTDCAVRFIPDYSNLGELFEECLSGNRCIDGRTACEVMNNTMSELIRRSWVIGEESVIKGFVFESIYVLREQEPDKIAFINEGECLNREIGSSYLIPSFPGTIENTLTLCF